MTEQKPRPANDQVREAEEVVTELRAALQSVAVTLPSLRIDLASCTGTTPRPLVELSRCNLQTARRLTAALHSARLQEAGQ
jgi:hypothetical protein